MLPVVFSAGARTNLDDIQAYLADRFSPRNAERYVQRISSACLAIGPATYRGTPQEDIGSNVRRVGFERRVAIFFLIEADRVVILGVDYAGRLPYRDARY